MTSSFSLEEARRIIYKLLSISFIYPEERLFYLLSNGSYWKHLINAALKIHVTLYESVSESIEKGKQLLHPTSLEKFQEEYIKIFSNTISLEVSLYGTQYENANNIFKQAQELSDIQGFYNAFGVKVSSLTKERCDFLPMELEFMSFLIQKEEYAKKHHGEEEINICMNAQKKFLTEYLLPWVPAFAIRVQEKINYGFYHILPQILENFLLLEMQIFPNSCNMTITT